MTDIVEVSIGVPGPAGVAGPPGADGAPFIILDRAISVGAGKEFATFALARDWIRARVWLSGARPLVTVYGHVSVSGDIGTIDSSELGRIVLRGGTPIVECAISSVPAVDGVAGAWDVTYQLVDADDVEIGDYVIVENVVPQSKTTSTVSGRTPFGAIQMPYFKVGELAIAGTAASWANSVLPSYISNGDILLASAETRVMSGVGSNSATLGSALEGGDLEDVQYHRTLRAGTGTITTSGTSATLIGDGTAFTTQFNPNDVIFPVGFAPLRVITITDDTHMTVAFTINIASPVNFGVLTPAATHHGCWQVLDVPVANGGTLAANRIKVRNTTRTAVGKPRIVNITGGDVHVIKDSLTTTDGHGLIVSVGEPDIDQIVIRGPATSSKYGLQINSNRASALCGTRTGWSGFGWSVRVSRRGFYDGSGAFHSGAAAGGIHCDLGTAADLDTATISGHGGDALLLGKSAGASISATLFAGCTGKAVRKEVGSSNWGDHPQSWCNGGAPVTEVGAALSHWTGLMSVLDLGGLNTQNGGLGRATGFLSVCDLSRGMNHSKGSFEAEQMCIVGAAVDGVQLDASTLKAGTFAGVAGSRQDGVDLAGISNLEAENIRLLGNASSQIRIAGLAVANVPGSRYAREGAAGILASDGARVNIEGAIGDPSLSFPVNLTAPDGSIIRDGQRSGLMQLLRTHSGDPIMHPGGSADTEVILKTESLPAIPGVNGLWIYILWIGTGTASKTVRGRIGSAGAGVGGTAFLNRALTTTLSWPTLTFISVRSAASQIMPDSGPNNSFAQSANAAITATVNTAAPFEIPLSTVLSAAAVAAGDTVGIGDYKIWMT